MLDICPPGPRDLEEKMLLMQKYIVLYEKELQKLIGTSKKLCQKRTELSSAFKDFGMSLNTFRVAEGNSQFASPGSVRMAEEVFTVRTLYLEFMFLPQPSAISE
jgi:hypothetical protein